MSPDARTSGWTPRMNLGNWISGLRRSLGQAVSGLFSGFRSAGPPSVPPPQNAWTPQPPAGFGVESPYQHYDAWGVPIAESYDEPAVGDHFVSHNLGLMAAQRILTLVKQNFVIKSAGGTGIDGDPWAPLSPSTLAARARKGTGSKFYAAILRDTGVLFNSLYAEVSSDEIVIGTNTEYARYHHEGTSRMPARPLWPRPLPRVWLEEIRDALQAGIKLQMRAGK